jgi:hypothetical protein
VPSRTRSKPAPSLSPAQVKVIQKNAARKATKSLAKQYMKSGIPPEVAAAPTKTTRSGKTTEPAAAAPTPQVHYESTLSRNAKTLWPHLIVGALLGLGESLYYLGRAGVPHLGALVALVVTVLGGMLAILVHAKAPVRLRLWGDLCLTAGSLWLVWCVARGLDWTVAAVLLWSAAALSARWWSRHRHPYAGAPVEKPKEHRETIPEAWGRYVSCQKGALPGVELTDSKQGKHTQQWTVTLPREGTETVQTVYAKLPRLCHALNRNMEDLIWEQHQSIKYAGVLQVVTNSPIKKPVMFDAPRVRNGGVLLGPYADAKDEAYWRVYTENSMWNGFVFGGTGSGKSRIIDTIAVSLLAMGNTVVWFCDGQNGASSPALKKHCDWFVRGDEFHTMLDALERIADYRQERLVHDDDVGFTPSPEYPGILVILDEMHEMTRVPKNTERLESLSARTRKLGIAFLGASQHTGLEVFGGKERMRGSFLAGNCVALRIKSRIAGQLIPGLELDPTKLPKIPGYGYTVESEENTATRTAPFRARWLLSEKEKAEKGLTDYASVEEWFGRFPSPLLDQNSANSAGHYYLNRAAIAQRAKEDLAAKINGGVPPTPRDAPPARATEAGTDPFAGMADLPDFQMIPDVQQVIMPDGLTEPQQGVYMAVVKGYLTPKDIATYLGFTVKHIGNQLGPLVEAGHLVKTGAGPAVTYSLPADDTASDE